MSNKIIKPPTVPNNSLAPTLKYTGKRMYIFCYKYGPHVCNGSHDLSMIVYDLNDIMILNIKGVDYRCFVFNMSKNNAIKLLKNSVLHNKRVL